MKKVFKNLFKGAVVGLMICGMLAVRSFGTGVPLYFNITNYISSGYSVTSWPTNSAGTNGIPQQTGKPVPIYNAEHIGMSFQGFAFTSNNFTVGFDVRTAMSSGGYGGVPIVSYGTNTLSTNATVLLQTDWSTTPNWVTFTVPAITNGWFNLQTNWTIQQSQPPYSDANYVGVYSITSTVAASMFLTNTTLSINAKLLPTPLIGQ